MHLTNPYDFTISVHRFMSGGAVNGARLGVIKRYCDEQRDAEHSFTADDDFDERLGLTCLQMAALRSQPEAPAVTPQPLSGQSVRDCIDRATSTTLNAVSRSPGQPQNVTINAGNIVFPPNLSPIASSPVPCNPPKKRRIEILEQLAEGMKSMSANFTLLLEEAKEDNRGEDSFHILEQ